MKKFLCGILCASAGAALAVESTVATIEVREIDSKALNTIVAIPGLDLDGNDLAISNLVKTTKNLSDGDKLMVYHDQRYKTWELENGHWAETTDIFKSGDGVESATTGTPASDFRMKVGSGIWLSRNDSETNTPFYVYALRPDSMTSTIPAGKTMLVGNPTTTTKAFSFSGCANGDKIYLPLLNRTPEEYTFDGTKEKWFRFSVSNGTISREDMESSPYIGGGVGFWYKSTGNSDVTLSWAE